MPRQGDCGQQLGRKHIPETGSEIAAPT